MLTAPGANFTEHVACAPIAEGSVQLVGVNVPDGAVKVTVPSGLDAVPASVSVIVAEHVV